MSKKHKKTCKTVNYFEHSPLFISVLTSCVFIPFFASVFGSSLENTISTVELKMPAITA